MEHVRPMPGAPGQWAPVDQRSASGISAGERGQGDWELGGDKDGASSHSGKPHEQG
ncbi:hypothetical protein CaCOL14_005292 [Colletotrichum acutatum]